MTEKTVVMLVFVSLGLILLFAWIIGEGFKKWFWDSLAS